MTLQTFDSTRKGVETSMSTTGGLHARGMEMHSESFKTTGFTWLVVFAMISIFIMVVLLIHVTAYLRW